MPSIATLAARKPPSRQAQRHQREGEDAVQGQPQHFSERILGLAGVPLRTFVEYGLLSEADPRHHAAQQSVALRHCQQGVHHDAIHESKVARVQRNGDIRELGDEPIKDLSRPALEGRLAGPHAVRVDASAQPSPAAHPRYLVDPYLLAKTHLSLPDSTFPWNILPGSERTNGVLWEFTHRYAPVLTL